MKGSTVFLALAMALVSGYGWSQGEEGSPPDTKHLVCVIDTKDFGAETVRIGDLNGDGAPDLLFVQSVYGPRTISCLTATTVFGEVLWQTGSPSKDNGRLYSDLPVQVYDWDRDGRNEVLYVRQAVYAEGPGDPSVVRERGSSYEGDATLVILDGRDGKEEGTLSLPAPADDSIVFADLTGRGRREDLVVKDRYWNMWGVAHDATVLWHWEGSTGHYPAVADVDNDGKEEVFVGYALIDHDGKVLFSKDPGGAHQDAVYIAKAPGGIRLFNANSGIHCLASDGAELWHHPVGEAQHVLVDRFRADSPLDVIVVDRTPLPTSRRDETGWAILYAYDLAGQELWRHQQEPGAWAIATVAVDWFGGGGPKGVLVYGHGPGRPAVIYNGKGEIVETLPMAYPPQASEEDRRAGFYALAADVWGDSRQEAILFGARGACIYANARLLEVPTLYNETGYPGM
ncbi:MAG: hypothetical protein JW741_06490 [Sedimentisphaerales bacterium]|nr:hypothetical protein [Sedimentisphaerales bacterium]